MGAAVAPALRGGPWRRALEGQAVVDASWVFSHRGDGTFDREMLIAGAVPQYGALIVGTVIGVLGQDLLPSIESLGPDVVFPTFFLALLFAELRNPFAKPVAMLAIAITVVLVPLTPPGIPIIAAGAAALLGLRRG